MAGSAGGSDDPEFQIAPMIDVLLVLLVFFMSITSAQVLRVDQSIHLPVATDALKKETSRSEALINVRWDPVAQKAEVIFEERLYPHVSDLVPLLKERRGKDAAYRLVLRADRDLPAVHVARVMDACAEAGIADIAFSAVNKE